jgi:hypothetical protein
MPTETGIISNIKQRPNNFSVAVNNKWFGGHGKCTVEKKDSVKIDWIQDGKYMNIKSIEKIEQQKPTPKRTDPLADDIHLQVCLKASATIHAGTNKTAKEIATYTKELMHELWA